MTFQPSTYSLAVPNRKASSPSTVLVAQDDARDQQYDQMKQYAMIVSVVAGLSILGLLVTIATR